MMVGFFVLVAAFEVLSQYLSALRRHVPLTPAFLFEGIPSWLVQAPLLVPIRWMTVRLPLVPGTLRRRIPAYLLGGVLYTFATCLGTALVFRMIGLLDQPVVSTVSRSFFIFLPTQFALFGVIVGVFHALDNRRQAEEHAQARVQLAASLTEARLHALRSQLSPHFFFNTLNAISTLSMQGRNDEVVQMVSGLGDLVRASLDEKLPHEVPLSRELELLEIYLGIQRIRFTDWLRVEQQVDPRTLDLLVPTLVLQPLVENAIEHGGADIDGMHRVLIRCGLDGDALEISIANPEPTGGTVVHSIRLGVGLRNTTERLRQLHPGRHEFRHGPVPEGGFQTIVRIAARHAEAGSGRADALPTGAPA
jgi:sensor histidine kinase YesM